MGEPEAVAHLVDHRVLQGDPERDVRQLRLSETLVAVRVVRGIELDVAADPVAAVPSPAGCRGEREFVLVLRGDSEPDGVDLVVGRPVRDQRLVSDDDGDPGRGNGGPVREGALDEFPPRGSGQSRYRRQMLVFQDPETEREVLRFPAERLRGGHDSEPAPTEEVVRRRGCGEQNRDDGDVREALVVSHSLPPGWQERIVPYRRATRATWGRVAGREAGHHGKAVRRSGEGRPWRRGGRSRRSRCCSWSRCAG